MEFQANTARNKAEMLGGGHYCLELERLVDVVQRLSLARDIGQIAEIVRHEAHELTGADGASFVLREGDFCHYADEEAITPLWKGQRFQVDCCVSGWVMQHGQPVAIEDIYADSRVPVDAYRSTFVKSMLVVPIRNAQPIGAIGNYWARPHRPSDEEIRLLQALANTTAVALENAQLYADLERRVRERTAALEHEITERKSLEDELRRMNESLEQRVAARTADLTRANAALERTNLEMQQIAFVAAHDLQTPLRSIVGFAQLLHAEYHARLDARANEWLEHLAEAARRMSDLNRDLLAYSRVDSRGRAFQPVDTRRLFDEVVSTLAAPIGESGAHVDCGDLPVVMADRNQLAQVLHNLIDNAIKFRSGAAPEVHVSARKEGDVWEFAVRDNGIGIPAQHREQIFGVFRRLHTQREYPGTGIGLAISRRVIHRHGGQLWVESEPGRGSTFYFTLPDRGP